MAVTWKKLAFSDDVVLKSLFDANTILAATSDNTPAAVTVGEQTLVGRITSGAIAALNVTQLQTLLNVENGADVTDATNVASAGAVMLSTITTKGDILAGTGSAAIARLGVGTNDQILMADSTAGGGTVGIKWADAPSGGMSPTLFAAKGDILIASDNDTPAILSKAASDYQVLRTRTGATNDLEYQFVTQVDQNAAAIETPYTTQVYLGQLRMASDTGALYICTSAS